MEEKSQPKEDAPIDASAIVKELNVDDERKQLIKETFSKVLFFLKSGNTQGYIKFNDAQMYRFDLESAASNQGCANEIDSNEKDLVQKTWQHKDDKKTQIIDLVMPEEMKQFGKIQKNLVTGETYMLIPLEINLLLDPNKSCDLSQPSPYPNSLVNNEQESKSSQDRRVTFQLPAAEKKPEKCGENPVNCTEATNVVTNPESWDDMWRKTLHQYFLIPENPLQSIEDELSALHVSAEETKNISDSPSIEEASCIENLQFEESSYTIPQLKLNFNLTLTECNTQEQTD